MAADLPVLPQAAAPSTTMRHTLLALHLMFAAVWLGCIVTEALFERALLPQGNDARKTLANLRVRVDQFVELPAIVAVIVTGAALWLQAPPTSQGFTLMFVAGCLAIVANLVCVWLVFARRDAARSEHWPRFDTLDHRQHAWGTVVLVGVLVALAAGIGGRGAAG